MSLELTRWLANQLRLAVLEEDSDGSLQPNSHARNLIKDESPANLLAGTLRLIGWDTDKDSAVDRALEAARSGTPTHVRPGQGIELFVVPAEEGRATVILATQETPLAQKLQAKAAAADLAAGVSHEVANALSAIVGWAQVARERPDKAPPNEALGLIEKSAQVARDATQDLLRMVRNSNHEKTSTDLGVVIRDVVRLLRPEAQQRRVSVDIETQDSVWVQGKRSQLFSIVWNLAHNAVQMVPSGGEVRLKARRHGDLIELEVRDNGPGMSEEQQEQAFEAYYTTREEGTGLGLAIVRGTVEALGGRVRLDTSPGHGANFRIQLPLVERRADSETFVKAPRISRVIKPEDAESTHVLVVEDDAGVRGLIGMTLALGGLEATCVATAAEALAHDQHFSVALIDLTLPDNRGDLLLGELRNKGTVTRAAIMSGGAPPPDMGAEGKPERWLRKPFEPSDLMVCVRALLDAAPGTLNVANS